MQNQLNQDDQLDIYGSTIDLSESKHDRLRNEMMALTPHLLKGLLEDFGYILKEHSSQPMEISYYEDRLAPMRLF